MKKNSIHTLISATIASFLAVVVSALLWCLLPGTASGVFCVLTLVSAAAFVYCENRLVAYEPQVDTLPDTIQVKAA